MTLFHRVKRPLGLAALVLTLVLSGASFPSSRVASTFPCPEYMTVTYYYTDDTYTVEAGQSHMWCDGRRTGHGIMTLYDYTEVMWACCGCSNCWQKS
jgi:hypothetical protein